MTTTSSTRRLALVMGVANHKSIAWACAQSLLRKNFDCIITYQSERFAANVEKLTKNYLMKEKGGRILGALPCNVQDEEAIPKLFAQDLPTLISDQEKLDSIVHNIAYCDMKQGSQLSQVDWKVYAQAQQISTYSFLQLAQTAVETNRVHQYRNDESTIISSSSSSGIPTSLIALTYLGAVRATPHYQSMGPAKAALEAIVRQLAAEYGPTHGLHVLAVSAGPINTLSSRGIPHFSELLHHVQKTAPLRRSESVEEVAQMVAFLSSEMTGVTGQTLYVDAGYSSVVPVGT